MDKQTKLIVFAFCIIKLLFHLLADGNSGFQGDELLHIETGNHLALGFMEFPPLISVLAFIQNLFNSESVFIHHIFAHISAVLILVIISKIIIELGGKSKAVFLVLLCILIAPGFGRSQQLFQPVVFSQLFWVLNFYILTKYVKYLEKKHLWILTFTTALAFLTKYDALFFIFGISSLLFFKSTREALVKHKFWWNILVFVLLIGPNIIWQVLNDFPVLKMFDRLYETQLDELTPIHVISGLVMALNPVTLLISIAGIAAMFHRSMKAYRPLSISILIAVLILAFSKGKGYYFFPVALVVFAFGGVFWQNVILAERRKWMMYPVTILLLLGVVLIPFGMPIFSLESYLKHDYKYEKEEIPGGEYGIKFDERYSKDKWSVTLKEVQNVYEGLSKEEKENAIIWGKHYSQAGIVNLFHESYGIPNAFSLHGSFYNWVPKGEMPNTTIVLCNDVGNFFQNYFNEVVRVKTIYNPYADREAKLYQHIYICKEPKYSFDELKELFKDRVFE